MKTCNYKNGILYLKNIIIYYNVFDYNTLIVILYKVIKLVVQNDLFKL